MAQIAIFRKIITTISIIPESRIKKNIFPACNDKWKTGRLKKEERSVFLFKIR
jgi:hypothetical protein